MPIIEKADGECLYFPGNITATSYFRKNAEGHVIGEGVLVGAPSDLTQEKLKNLPIAEIRAIYPFENDINGEDGDPIVCSVGQTMEFKVMGKKEGK